MCKTNKNIYLIVMIISMSFYIYGQEVSALEGSNNYNIYFGIGLKYHINKGNYEFSNKKKYLDSYAFSIGLDVDFWENKKNFIGMELLGYNGTYGESPISPKNFTIISNIYYKRNISICNNLSFLPGGGLTLFSNDVVNMANIYFSFEINRDFDEYAIFIKNSFRFAPKLVFDNPPWILIIGLSYEL